jgi:hypothetical protein
MNKTPQAEAYAAKTNATAPEPLCLSYTGAVIGLKSKI